MSNLLLNCDSYKHSHFLQYPPNTEVIYSYIESRGVSSSYPELANAEIVHFGPQMFLQEYLSKPITQNDIYEAESILAQHGLPFNKTGWQYILKEYNGYMPVRIESLPEGSVIKPGIPQVQIYNTDTSCAWLTSYLETALLRAIWYPSTVATISREMKKVIATGLLKTQGNMDGLDFKLHDFGSRGVSSKESAGIGGLAHLVNFQGTDTLEAIMYAKKYYNEPGMPGYSIPAAEHSTITSWGRENELDAYRNMLNQFGKPSKIVAVVSDSYDIYNAVENLWGSELRQEVIDSGATVVIRPDSGDPSTVVVKCLELLSNKFEFTVNTQGYKVLPSYIRLIQGDGINTKSILELISHIAASGWCISNVAFGMGGALLQKCDRDTFKYAMKCSATRIKSEVYDVYKDPITDPGKVSKKGVQAVKLVDKKYIACRLNELWPDNNQLQTVYSDGILMNSTNFADIRERAKI